MTKTKALKNFINKFLGYEADGNSVTSVLVNTTENAEGGGGSEIGSYRTGDANGVNLAKYGKMVFGYIGNYTISNTFELPEDFWPLGDLTAAGQVSNNIPLRYIEDGTEKNCLFNIKKNNETGLWSFQIHGPITDPNKAYITDSQFFYFTN